MRFISRKNRDKVQKCHTFCFINVLFHYIRSRINSICYAYIQDYCP